MVTAIRTVGIIGAGRMGLPIVGHVAKRGYDVVVFDIDAGRRVPVENLGARWARDARELAASSDAVLVCVGYDEQLRLLLSQDGMLPVAPAGSIVAVLSTVHPRTMHTLVDAATPFGVSVVDATVCRGGRAADEGSLLTFVGGEAATVDRLEPVLACYSSDIVRTGGPGTAQVAKAANNLVMWACLIADHEALALAKRFGVDSDALRAALAKSSADNYVLRNWGVNTMAWAEDDMAIVQAMADEAGIGLPQAGLNRELCRGLKARRFRLDEYGR